MEEREEENGDVPVLVSLLLSTIASCCNILETPIIEGRSGGSGCLVESEVATLRLAST